MHELGVKFGISSNERYSDELEKSPVNTELAPFSLQIDGNVEEEI